MEKIVLTRQELYNLVWNESLTAISKRFNVRYTQLRKICIEMKVPVPQNGHWSKLKFGKPVTVIELPEDYEGANEVQIRATVKTEQDSNVLTIAKKTEVDEIINDQTLPFKVPKRLTNPDKLIIAAQKNLTEHPHAWWNNRGMVRTVHGQLDIRISHESFNRAFCFLDTFIKLLRARGHDVNVEYGHVQAIVDGEKFDFNLREKNQQITFVGWGNSEYKATGLLSFTIEGYYGKRWNDGKISIEQRLPEILAKLEIEAKEIKAQHLIWEEEQRIQDERERVIREQQQRIEKEKSDFKDLYQQAKRWQRARFMREYLIAYEQDAVEKGGLTAEVKKWLECAGAKIDWYDPLVNKADALLNHLNINKLLDS